jgi:hypothetical protein
MKFRVDVSYEFEVNSEEAEAEEIVAAIEAEIPGTLDALIHVVNPEDPEDASDDEWVTAERGEVSWFDMADGIGVPL